MIRNERKTIITLKLVVGVLLAVAYGARGSTEDCSTVDFTNFDIAPAMIDSVPPEYSESTAMSVSGTVIVEVDVNEDGSVCSVRMMRGGHAAIANAARTAARASRYAPAVHEGIAVPGRLTVEYSFVIRDPHRRPPKLVEEAPMISNVADSVRLHPEYGDLVPQIFRDGILFQGDIAASAVDQVLTETRSKLGDGEVIWVVRHYLVYPDSLRRRRRAVNEQFVDLEVTTSRGVGMNASGRTYFYVNEGGEYRLLELTSKWMN